MSYFIRLLLSICIVTHCSCQNELPATYMSIESVSRKDFLRGRFDPLDDPNFVIIEQKYADKDSMLMQSEAYEAFLKMAAAGEDDGHSFCILSATRNFAYQKYLWENKWYGIFPINGTIDACTTYPNELTRAKNGRRKKRSKATSPFEDILENWLVESSGDIDGFTPIRPPYSSTVTSVRPIQNPRGTVTSRTGPS